MTKYPSTHMLLLLFYLLLLGLDASCSSTEACGGVVGAVCTGKQKTCSCSVTYTHKDDACVLNGKKRICYLI